MPNLNDVQNFRVRHGRRERGGLHSHVGWFLQRRLSLTFLADRFDAKSPSAVSNAMNPAPYDALRLWFSRIGPLEQGLSFAWVALKGTFLRLPCRQSQSCPKGVVVMLRLVEGANGRL